MAGAFPVATPVADPSRRTLSAAQPWESQEEVDDLWDKCPRAAKKGRAADRAHVLDKLLQDEDSEKADRAMKAMLQMKKIDIAKLQEAHDG